MFDRGVSDFDDACPKQPTQFLTCRLDSIRIPELRQVDGEARIILRNLEIGMCIAHQSNDFPHTGPHSITVQMLDLAVEICHGRIKAFLRREVESASMSCGQGASQIFQVFAPLLSA